MDQRRNRLTRSAGDRSAVRELSRLQPLTHQPPTPPAPEARHRKAERWSRGIWRIERINHLFVESLIHGAQSLVWNLNREKTRLGRWIAQLERRAHHNIVIVAVANKLVRICWKILTSGAQYRKESPLLA